MVCTFCLILVHCDSSLILAAVIIKILNCSRSFYYDEYYIHHLSPDFDWWQLCTTNWWSLKNFLNESTLHFSNYWNFEFLFFIGLVLKNSVPISSVVLWNQLKSLLEMLRWTSLLFMISSWLVDPPGFQRYKSWFQT